MRRYLIILFFIMSACLLQAQDLHFTQFYAAPLQLNPAHTGFFQEDYRVGGNFKQQWPWARDNRMSNYRSLSVYGDMAMLRKKLPSKDWMGMGLVFFNDNAGDGNLSVNKAGLSFAYHKVMGHNDQVILSMGVGIRFIQKRIDYTALYFDSQWQDIAFDTDLPNQEANATEAIIYPDLNAGLRLTIRVNEYLSTHIGLGMTHLNRPRESFYGMANRLGMRPAIHAGVDYQISRSLHIEPGFFYSYQKKAQEGVASLLMGFHPQADGFLRESVFFIGAAYRTKDALVPQAGYQYKRFKLIANYDVNLSKLREVSYGVGGFEISMVYLGLRPSTLSKLRVPCPRL
ncbi:MAG: PorP/SprF family type IX secretion system membrane protein [Chitinophagales bacterium]